MVETHPASQMKPKSMDRSACNSVDFALDHTPYGLENLSKPEDPAVLALADCSSKRTSRRGSGFDKHGLSFISSLAMPSRKKSAKSSGRVGDDEGAYATNSQVSIQCSPPPAEPDQLSVTPLNTVCPSTASPRSRSPLHRGSPTTVGAPGGSEGSSPPCLDHGAGADAPVGGVEKNATTTQSSAWPGASPGFGAPGVVVGQPHVRQALAASPRGIRVASGQRWYAQQASAEESPSPKGGARRLLQSRPGNGLGGGAQQLFYGPSPIIRKGGGVASDDVSPRRSPFQSA